MRSYVLGGLALLTFRWGLVYGQQSTLDSINRYIAAQPSVFLTPDWRAAHLYLSRYCAFRMI